MKHLPKYLRPRWRYLGVGIEAHPDAAVDRRSFQRDLWYAAGNLLGDPGSADVDCSVYGFSFRDGDGECVVRVRRGEVERARAVLACLDDVSGHPVRVTVRGVGGTVRACEERYLGRPLESADEKTVVHGNADRSAVVRGSRVDVRTDDGLLGATDYDYDYD
ncbi:Rpp14/Pop5 family protein [Halomarina litorea]|uniref:Rpp14/Pop5 family protein n=1 Tax=Halomarina litorea TaxID=2961595 RepID=UPI0020C47E0B|nr:Rpp14/Pop5 family protein [Halomarina sp. BCD28]